MGILSLLISGGIVALFFTMPIATFTDPAQADLIDGAPIWQLFIKPGGPVGTLSFIKAFYENTPEYPAYVSESGFPLHSYYIILAGLGVIALGAIMSFISVFAKKDDKLRILMGLTMFILFLGGGAVAAGTAIMMAWIPTQTSSMIILETFAISDLNYSFPIYAAIIGGGLIVILSIIGLIGAFTKK
ncbi:MAG: hypothetical protein FK733_12055 [Asgard group archaeon]|nr:hypothetical protein [Asgard group archaeon]